MDAENRMTVDAPRAPIIFFELPGAYQAVEGIVSVSLVTRVVNPTESGGLVGQMHEVAHLRCTVRSAQHLIDALSKAILAATPAVGGSQ